MPNISLLGAIYNDVPAVTLPQDPTGTATFYDYNFMGKMAEFIETVYEDEVALADTGFASWTPSTTAKAIVATTNAKTFVADMAHYEYILKWETTFTPVYTEGATLKAQVIWEGADQYQILCKRPNSIANIEAMNFNGNTCNTYFSVPLLRYYNTSGTVTYTHSISYGIYPGLTASTFSSSTSNTPTVTIKTPTLNARCNSSYFAVARAPELDQTESIATITGKLYRIEIAGAVREMYADFFERYNAQ